MDENRDLNDIARRFNALTDEPLNFLNGNFECSENFVNLASDIYWIATSYWKRNHISNQLVLPQIFTEGLDEEQIWQQIELINDGIGSSLDNTVSLCAGNQHFKLVKFLNHGKVTRNNLKRRHEQVKQVEHYDDDEDENTSDADVLDQEGHDKNVVSEEKTVVDDKFFSLREMEKFLDKQEEDGGHDVNDEDINYFDEINSSNDDGGSDFSDVSNKSDSGQSYQQQGDCEENDDDDDNDDGDDDDDDDDDNDDDDALLMNNGKEMFDQNSSGDATSARQVKYEDYFNSNKSKKTAGLDSLEEIKDRDDVSQLNLADEDLCPHNEEADEMTRQIRKLEEKSLAQADWQMKGETTAEKRPVNSLLEEVLTFDHIERPSPDVTDEHTFVLENVIKQRIKDKAWDDVERKVKEVRDPLSFKKKLVLESEKSKLSLHEIYEKEYLQKAVAEKEEEKENASHVELKMLMKGLFYKLDLLSNFHFKSAAPTPEIRVMKNLPAVTVEDVQPVTHSDAQMLAPEEIQEKKEILAKEEKLATDRKRERRKKKALQKARSAAREKKLERLAEFNPKLKSIQAMNKLEKSSKTPGSQTTIIKSRTKEKSKSGTSSKTFFSRLEDKSDRKNMKQRTNSAA